MSRAAGQSGFTMMEVMVAMAVLAVGVMGLAATQLQSLKVSRGALYQSMATVMAVDMAHRIRANAAEALNGAYHMACWTDEAGCTTAVADCRTHAGCNAAQMAADDLDQWRQWLAGSHPDTGNGLPGGAGRVCISSTADPARCDNAPDSKGVYWYVIQVSWLESGHPVLCDTYHTPDDDSTGTDDRPCFVYKLPMGTGWDGWYGRTL